MGLLGYFLAIALCSTSQLPVPQGNTGSISGRVLDETGKVIVGASVWLNSLDEPGPGHRQIVKSDPAGLYLIEHIRPGKYGIGAFKPEAGYPEVFFAFNLAPNQKIQQVTITEGQRMKGIDIQLGPKSGFISFHIVNRLTRNPIAVVDYRLCQVQHPTWCLNAGAKGEAEFSAPPTDITIEVSAKGYRSATYMEGGKQYVSMAPGERKSIMIALEPLE